MSLETAIQNLADAIVFLANTYRAGMEENSAPGEKTDVAGKAVADAGFHQFDKENLPDNSVEINVAIEGEIIAAGEKTPEERHKEAFNLETGYVTKPFLKLSREAKTRLLSEFGLAKLSLASMDQVPALVKAIAKAQSRE